MIREALYQKTENILFQAYFNNTLQHGDCYACAAGNIVASGRNYQLVEGTAGCGDFVWRDINGREVLHKWDDVFYTAVGQQTSSPEAYYGAAKRQIDATGYTWQELAQIEKAFETAPQGNSDEDYMFNGLVAVLDVLKEIHQVEAEVHTTTQQKFQQHYQVRTA